MKTFAPQHLSKKAGRKPLHLHSYPLSVFFPLLLPPPSILTPPLAPPLQHWSQIRHSFCWGNLKPSSVLDPPPPSLAVQRACFSSLRCPGGGGSLKGNALLVLGLQEHGSGDEGVGGTRGACTLLLLGGCCHPLMLNSEDVNPSRWILPIQKQLNNFCTCL